MKRIWIAGLAFSLLGISASYAQGNGGYVDDRYYSGSQAEQDAKTQAKAEKKQRQNDDTEYYTSSGNDGYNYDGDARSYNTASSQYDDSYIDYDDDSYTTRMRRFYYPMAGAGYWGSVYSPYWYDPFWSDPFYGWGGWYRPGFSIGFGIGPYWNSCWGLSAWYGFGGFSYWGYPAYGYGWGGGFYGWGAGYGGYWNGYYAGLYDGGRYNSYRRGVNYGPRGNVGIRSVGNYGPGRIAERSGNGMVTPVNGRINNNNLGRGNAIRLNDGRRNAVRQQDGNLSNRAISSGDNGRMATPRANNRINLNNATQRSFEVDGGNRAVNSGGQRAVQQDQPARRGGFFNGIFNGGGQRSVERSGGQRSFQQRSERTNNTYQPSRSSAPSRSYSAPAPSRSSSGSFGGGSRSFGGGSGGGGIRGGGRR